MTALLQHAEEQQTQASGSGSGLKAVSGVVTLVKA